MKTKDNATRLAKFNDCINKTAKCCEKQAKEAAQSGCAPPDEAKMTAIHEKAQKSFNTTPAAVETAVLAGNTTVVQDTLDALDAKCKALFDKAVGNKK